jgi:putative endopeptidase
MGNFMIRHFLSAASVVALAACASTAPVETAKAPAAAEAPAAAVIAKPKPELGTWGFDLAGKDTSVKPGDSFYRYANGTWVKNTPIPEDKSNYGMFTALADRSDARTREIIEAAAAGAGAPGSDAQKVGDYYKSFMDEAAIEAAGLTPLAGHLAEVDRIKTKAELTNHFARLATTFTGVPFISYVYIDEKKPDTHIGIMAQGGLGLPDKDMYDASKKQFEPIRAGYKKYIADMFRLAKFDNADKRAAAVYALEEKLAAAHWSRLENRDPEKTYNKMKPSDLAKLAPGVDWANYLKILGLGNETAVNVNQPTAFAKMAKLVSSQPTDTWKDYTRMRILDEAAPYLSKAFVDLNFAFRGTTLAGTPKIKERWKRGVDGVSAALGESVGKLYVEKYFTSDTKAKADQLVKNLLVAMGQRLDSLSWMGAETKAKAKQKLATYNPKIGYPNVWRDYSALDVKAGDPFGNAERSSAFEYQRYLKKLGQPIDREEWGMTPQTVNAYYNPVLNEIVFPAAILQGPFFDPNADDAVNYGGIGAVIGHEISHGFDDQGSQYAADGSLSNWWTKDDREKFEAATKMLAAQYDAYCPFPAADGKAAQCVNGKLTMGENIADLAGLTVAYQAYKISLNGKEAPVIDGLTGDQRFFLGWAQVWRRSYRDKELQNRLVTDVHSPSEYRASVVRNLDAWYAAFNPQAGETLYLTREQRVKIW